MICTANIHLMKRILLISSLVLIYPSIAFSQIESGIYLGTNTTHLNPSTLFIEDNAIDKYTLAIKNSNYGFHAGVYLQAMISNLYLQSGLYFQSNSYDYSLKNIDSPNNEEQILKERFNNLDIPISLGYKFLIFRIYTGPTANIFLNSSSDLNDTNGFKQHFKPVAYSYHLGIGVNIGRFRFDTKWEQNLGDYFDSITFKNATYKFDDNPSRLFFSLGYRF